MFGLVDTGKGWNSQVCPRAIEGTTTCHRMRHSLSLPTVILHLCERASTFSSWLNIVLSALSADSSSSKWTRDHPYGWPRLYFGMITLSRHSADRPPRAFHSSTHKTRKVMNSTMSQSRYFGMNRQCIAVPRLTWPAYGDGRKRKHIPLLLHPQ